MIIPTKKQEKESQNLFIMIFRLAFSTKLGGAFTIGLVIGTLIIVGGSR
jgi:hypothetical protein